MVVYCSKCGKKLGLLAAKHKAEDGSVMCASCLKEHKMKQDELKRQEEQRKQEQLKKQEEKNREIMRDYISKYLANKDEEFIDSISEAINEFFAGKEKATELEPYEVYEGLGGYENEKNLGLYELLNISTPKGGDEEDWDDFFDDVSDKFDRIWHTLDDGIKEKYFDAYALEEIESDFKEDLQKMHKLFTKKGIETSCSEILSVFAECIVDRAHEGIHEALEELDKYLNPMAKAFSMKFGEDITVEKVIKEAMRKRPDICDNFITITHFLGKFQLDYEEEEVKQLMEQTKEEIELEDFEKNLGAAPRKQKIEIGNFTELSGYEFEEYLKNLFELLGYTTVQTSLSGDQGADLILSKDDEKIVVQAKKYDGKVSNKAVQEIAAAKDYYNADKAMVVTNSSFTKSAIELAFSNDVELWDGRKLKSIIGDLESGSEESESFLSQELSFKEAEEVQNVTLRCPCCEKEFDYQVNVTEEGAYLEAGTTHELEIKCPYCGLPIGISLNVPSKPWTCRSCGKKFETKAAGEEHEKKCDGRRREN